MSIRLMSLAWEVDLPDSDKLVLLALADWSNDNGECWPSIAQLTKKCSKSERTIQGCIKSLCDGGHLDRIEVRGKGCRYIVHPRRDCAPAETAPRNDNTPAKSAPPQGTTQTPAEIAPNTSVTINTSQKTTSSSKARARKSSGSERLRDDWRPATLSRDTVSGQIIEHRGQEWARRTLETFRNHWRAADGPSSRKLDWQAAWANWIIEQDRRDGNGNSLRGRGQTGAGSNDGFANALRLVAGSGAPD